MTTDKNDEVNYGYDDYGVSSGQDAWLGGWAFEGASCRSRSRRCEDECAFDDTDNFLSLSPLCSMAMMRLIMDMETQKITG